MSRDLLSYEDLLEIPLVMHPALFRGLKKKGGKGHTQRVE